MQLEKNIYSSRIKFIWTEHNIRKTNLWISWPTNIPSVAWMMMHYNFFFYFSQWSFPWMEAHWYSLKLSPKPVWSSTQNPRPFYNWYSCDIHLKRDHTAPITLSNLAGNHVLAVRSPYLVSIPTDKPTAPLPVSAN